MSDYAQRLKSFIKSVMLPLPLDFLRWKLVDIYRFSKRDKNDKPHIYGIWCFVGMEGGGKTMSLVHYLEEMRKKYGDEIYISTNFFYKNEDFPITHWKDLLTTYDRAVIYAYDELQNEFNSRNYRDFPVELVYLLTQNRKRNGIQVVYTTQDYDAVDKTFRRRTRVVVSCRTTAGRLTHCRYYQRLDFEYYLNTVDVKRKIKVPCHSKWFVQSDALRELYDSYAMIESAKSKEYIGIAATNTSVDEVNNY